MPLWDLQSPVGLDLQLVQIGGVANYSDVKTRIRLNHGVLKYLRTP